MLYIFVFLSIFRLESTKGSYAKEWAKWEKQLRDTLDSNANYLESVQVNIFYFYSLTYIMMRQVISVGSNNYLLLHVLFVLRFRLNLRLSKCWKNLGLLQRVSTKQ